MSQGVGQIKPPKWAKPTCQTEACGQFGIHDWLGTQTALFEHTLSSIDSRIVRPAPSQRQCPAH
jgi:hypothetical protein